MADQENRVQVLVIGGGPGGYAAAFMAADLGLQVALVDKEPNPGGVCLYRGCIPSKALLHVAKVITEAKEAENWGVKFSAPKLDIDQMRSWKNDVVQKLTGGLGQLSKRRKIQYIQGSATFLDAYSVQIEMPDGKKQKLAFENAILATGSYPATIPNLPANSSRILNSSSALEIEDVPKRLLVIGGGYIGLELGTVYTALGSSVSVVEMLSGLLPGVDRDLVSVLGKRVDKIFDEIMLNSMVVETKEQKNGIKVTIKDKDGNKQDKIYDKILVSVGRKPNSQNIGLENTKIKPDEKGFIPVNIQRQTNEPSIYAIGDVAGEPMLAHKASHEGRVAAEVIAGRKAAFEPAVIPAVVFTDPEIAWCGITESQAKEEGRNVEVVRFPWGASGRATTLGRNDGVTKLIVDAETERIFGVGIVGSGAGELIAEGVLAVEMAAVVSDLELTIHPHPTLSETIMEAAETFFGTSTHTYRPKRRK